jgi:glyoxylase-like metal-dependent hydrolase (beta-lactamase superfamily II)
VNTGNIYPIKLTFGIPVSPDVTVERFVYAYAVDGEQLCLMDTGIAGAERVISMVLQKIGKDLCDTDIIILTHSHPDHIGAASLIQHQSAAQVWAHPNEQAWIEDIERQGRERPVPGFADLVYGSVTVNRLLADGDILPLGDGSTFKVLHTPGHSSGSISLLSEENGILFSGDVIPQPGGMPIYEDVSALASSLVRLADIENLTALYSSWGDPLYGQSAVEAIHAGIRYLKTTHDFVMKVGSELNNPDPMELCKRCVRMLELPPFAVNPLVARSLLAHKEAAVQNSLDSILAHFLLGGGNV